MKHDEPGEVPVFNAGMLLPSDSSCGALEHFFQAELGDEMALAVENLPHEQFVELQYLIHRSTRHYFQRRARADRGEVTFQHLTGAESTQSGWLKSALLYLPNRIAIHDPLANSALFFETFLGMNDESYTRRACREMARAIRDLSAARPLIADGTIDLVPHVTIHGVIGDLRDALRYRGEYHAAIKIGVGEQIYVDPPSVPEFDVEDMSFWVPDTPDHVFFWWAVSSCLAVVSDDSKRRMTAVGPDDEEWWEILYADMETGDSYYSIPRERWWLAGVLGHDAIFGSDHVKRDFAADTRSRASRIDVAIAELVDGYQVPSFGYATMEEIVRLRRDEEAFALFRDGFDAVYERVLQEDNDDVARYMRNVQRHAQHTLRSRGSTIERQMKSSPAMTHLVDSAVTVGGAAATWAISDKLTAGAVVGLAAGQMSYALNHALEKRRRRNDSRALVSDFFGYLIRAD